MDPNPSLPSSPVLPYDITEAPLNPVNVRSGKRKPQTKKYEYPLVFDADRLDFTCCDSYFNQLYSLHQYFKQLRRPNGKSVRLWSCRRGFGSKSGQTSDMKIGIHSFSA